MKIRVRRFDKDLPLPSYATKGAVALDCISRADVSIPPRSVGYAPLNIALKPPRGNFVLMAARSSLHKRGLMLANGIGIGDEDFAGDNDEYQAALYNFTDVPVEVKRGDRIVQIIVLPFDRVEWEEVNSHGGRDRGGFGSTG